MHTILRFFALVFLLHCTACVSDTPDTSTPITAPVAMEAFDSSSTTSIARMPPQTHGCSLAGKTLTNNEIWLRELNTLVAIVADSTTYDPDLGDSHRILLAYDTESCKVSQRIELPINISPDYAYYLAKVNYNNESKLVGITAFNSVYLYDAEQQKLLDPVRPKYLGKRNLDDATSGLIQHLELWEDYMVGYAQDGGAFVIDVTDKENPKSTPAFAEYRLEDGSYSSMFLLPGIGEEQQIIVPRYDYEEGVFAVNPLFTQPQNLDTQISRGARNNRFIILREKEVNRPAIVVDLVKRERVDIPNNIAKQNVKRILSWVEENS
ncbi:MAG: hypothetical protein AAGK47_00045 [Bacteroidota bacterium]